MPSPQEMEKGQLKCVQYGYAGALQGCSRGVPGVLWQAAFD